MRYSIIVAALSRLLMIVGFALLVPIIVSVHYNEPEITKVLALSSAITLAVSLVFYHFFPLKNLDFIRPREGFAIVTLGWVVVTIFGSLPFQLAGILNFTDAIFETMSGFTTTGASIFTDVEILPQGIIFWRSFTHWLGGMGIVVLYIALLSQMGVSATQIFKAEASGPLEKITPKIKDTAKILWYSYIVLTIACVVLLWLAGMSVFDSLVHTFGAIATGGFGIKNDSVAGYSSLAQIILIVFMFLGGANFGLYYLVYKRKSLSFLWKNEEFKLYSLVIFIASLLIAIGLLINTDISVFDSALDALFQVVSIITTTGYASVDYDQWPVFPKSIMFLLLFIGGSLGSTSGGIKIGRFLILFKLLYIELKKFSHPRSVSSLRINGKAVGDSEIYNTLLFFFVYIMVFAIGTLIMSGFGLDLVSATTAVAATLGDVGPGLGAVGPVQNFGFIHPVGKQFLTLLMLLGRLELFTVLILFLPDTWKKRK